MTPAEHFKTPHSAQEAGPDMIGMLWSIKDSTQNLKKEFIVLKCAFL